MSIKGSIDWNLASKKNLEWAGFICVVLCIHRLLAREGINAEHLARDLKSFELKVKFSLFFN